MSHFSVLVITPPDQDLEATISKLMEPFNENGEGFREGSKWDWWQIGGRWSGLINGKNTAPIGELPENIETFAVLTPDGKWHERGQGGWWGHIADDKGDAWKKEFTEAVAKYAPDHLATVVDFHV